MHEGGFTGRIVATILEELKKFPGQKVLRVKVLVGEMLHLEPESVKMHYQLLAKGSALEGVELELEQVPVTVEC
ncbi:MAG: hydrogenase maturation nickel metallochaperone HypA, partial [Candidatus Omnitrophota bacterium]